MTSARLHGDGARSIEQKSTRARATVGFLSLLAMAAFAANSLLARAAFQTTSIDAASFTAIRLVSGALVLIAIVQMRGERLPGHKEGWLSAALLFVYAAAFSFAYRGISTGAGALVLFASAQLTMISYGVCKGERTSAWGVLLSLGGLVAFLAPSGTAASLSSAALMAVAGAAWGGFSLLGKSSRSPVANTAGSFLWSIPFALVLQLFYYEQLSVDQMGATYALLSGGLTSAIGYAIWYWVRVRIAAISAGAMQLTVPVLSAYLGVVALGEEIELARVIPALAVLAGVAWITVTVRQAIPERKG